METSSNCNVRLKILECLKSCLLSQHISVQWVIGLDIEQGEASMVFTIKLFQDDLLDNNTEIPLVVAKLLFYLL